MHHTHHKLHRKLEDNAVLENQICTQLAQKYTNQLKSKSQGLSIHWANHHCTFCLKRAVKHHLACPTSVRSTFWQKSCAIYIAHAIPKVLSQWTGEIIFAQNPTSRLARPFSWKLMVLTHFPYHFGCPNASQKVFMCFLKLNSLISQSYCCRKKHNFFTPNHPLCFFLLLLSGPFRILGHHNSANSGSNKKIQPPMPRVAFRDILMVPHVYSNTLFIARLSAKILVDIHLPLICALCPQQKI